MLDMPPACVGQTSVSTATAALPSSGPVDEEHAILVRRMGRLQQQMSQLVLSYEAQLRHWHQQLMCQSIRLMLERTRAHWGLVGQERPEHPLWGRALAQAETEAVICRTGCVMDEHHWREGDLCRRSGQACTLADAAAKLE